MLSHAMVIPIGLTRESFMIGRSGTDDENDFELDGMGIQVTPIELVPMATAATAEAPLTLSLF